MSTYTYANLYTKAHNIVFLKDGLRNTLREVIRENGLSPQKLMQDWETIERGIHIWLWSGDLSSIVVEFYKPMTWYVSARWDVPIGYTGAGVVDDMWFDKAYLRQLIAKSARPTSDCVYRVILCTRPNAPTVDGLTACSLLSTGQLAARQAGTVIATGHMTAAATYWR